MGVEGYKNLEEFKTALRDKGTLALNNIYILYKEEFFNFCKRYKIADEDVLDIYQDAIIAFYENVQNGKLTELQSSLKTYIFSIGKYSVYNFMKKDNKTVSFEKEHIENLDLSIISDRMESESKVALVQEALKKIGERCRQVLILFYYHSYSIEALMHEMDYKNENVVRSHKSRCLKTLKEILSAEF